MPNPATYLRKPLVWVPLALLALAALWWLGRRWGWWARMGNLLGRVAPGANPWIWPAQGRISSRYGPRAAPTAGASTQHKGVDIANATGTPVIAPRAGRVTAIRDSASAGKMMTLTHPDGMETVYMHLSSRLVKLDDTVRQGQRIALMGATGNVTGPHLHFEMRTAAGVPLDPETLLPPYPTA